MKSTNRKASPPYRLIAEYWHNHGSDFAYDLHEPGCFACGWNRGSDTWESSELERAHIVARYLDGSSDPKNFLLLCRSCHLEAPMSSERSVLIQWAINHPHYLIEMTRSFERVAADQKFTEEDAEILLALPDITHVLRQKLKDCHITTHPNGGRPAIVNSMIVAAKLMAADIRAASQDGMQLLSAGEPQDHCSDFDDLLF